MKSYVRKYLRAWLKEDILFEYEGHVLKARIENISEGGVLFSSLPVIPKESISRVILPIPDLPCFQQTDFKLLQSYEQYELPLSFLRGKIKVIRDEVNYNDLSIITDRKIGGEFVNLSDKFLRSIINYVKKYQENMALLIRSVQASAYFSDLQLAELRIKASLLGHDTQQRWPLLREEIEKNYESIQKI